MSDGVAAIDREIHEEMAGALGRCAEKLEAAIAETLRLAALHEAATPAERPAIAAEHAAARAQAEKFVWYLQIQREAMGLRDHRRVFETFVIPPALAATPRSPAT